MCPPGTVAAAFAAEDTSAAAGNDSSSSAAPHDVWLSVHFLRHAEGTHNVGGREKPSGRSYAWVYGQQQHFDADLSPTGLQQARAAGERMPPQLLQALRQQQQQQQQQEWCCRTAVVYTSTLRRTIRTAYEALRIALASTSTAGAATAASAGGTAASVTAGATAAAAAAGDTATAAGGDPAAAAGDTAATAEPLDLPVIALEETREWAGGGHYCDGRHRLNAQAKWASALFKHITFEPYSEEDPLPPSMERESRQDIETRCLRFLRRLCDLAAASAGGASNRQAKGNCSSDSSSSSSSLQVLCIGHSAWFRSLFGLLSLFSPERRAVPNCGWICVSLSLSSLKRALPLLQQKCLRPRQLVLSESVPLHLPADGDSEALLKLQGASPDHWSVSSLSDLVRLHAEQPFTVLVYPFPSPASAGTPLAACLLRICNWMQQQPQYGQQQQQQQHIGFVRKDLQRTRMLIDGIACLRRLHSPQPDEHPLEVVAKERVQRENCLLICLLFLVTDAKVAEEEISLIMDVLLPTQGGTECCLRLDVHSIS